jgi:hypothetical protein
MANAVSARPPFHIPPVGSYAIRRRHLSNMRLYVFRLCARICKLLCKHGSMERYNLTGLSGIGGYNL